MLKHYHLHLCSGWGLRWRRMRTKWSTNVGVYHASMKMEMMLKCCELMAGAVGRCDWNCGVEKKNVWKIRTKYIRQYNNTNEEKYHHQNIMLIVQLLQDKMDGVGNRYGMNAGWMEPNNRSIGRTYMYMSACICKECNCENVFVRWMSEWMKFINHSDINSTMKNMKIVK